MEMKAKEIKIRKRLSFVMTNCTNESLNKYKFGLKKESPTYEILAGDNITKWSLRIFPNGDGEEDRASVSFYLNCKGLESTKFKAKYTLGIQGRTDKENYTTDEIETTGEFFAKFFNQGDGYHQFISHKKLFGKRKDLIIDGKLTFFCDLTLTAQTQAGNKSREVAMNETLSVDYKRMLDEEFFADFEITASDGITLKAHKAVLTARSPIFFAMLQQGIKKANEGCASVPDFDSIIMKKLLRFIYCNTVENLASIAHKLIYAAKKYQIDQLKELCVDEIISSLTTENLFQLLEITDQLTDTTNLFSKCCDLIFNDYETVSETEDWNNLPQNIAMKIIRELSLKNSVVFTGSF